MRGVSLQFCDDISRNRVYNGFKATKGVFYHEKIRYDPAVLPVAERLRYF